jgi:hypothetical protein
MLLIIRHRYPRIANLVGFVMGVAMLAIGIACGASATVLILGGGSSVLFSVVRFVGRRHARQDPGNGAAAA